MKTTAATVSRALALLAIASGALQLVAAHGAHDTPDAGKPESEESYAEYHMRSEHHIDSFDLESFFKLHDLDRDGILSRSELEAIYGLHHETSKEKSGDDEEHKRKTEEILAKVLATLDQNGDGVVTKTEFVAAGREGLPEFSHHEGLGHHYDSEGEYFLHHEEIYHSTPETQTEEAYTHPEDLAHFAHHEDIEREEEDKARKAQGLPPTDPNVPLDDQTAQPHHDELEANHGSQQIFNAPASGSEDPEEVQRQARAKQAAEQARRLRDAKKEAAARGAWGANGEFKKPKDKADRLRERIPYKYRVRSSFLGDF